MAKISGDHLVADEASDARSAPPPKEPFSRWEDEPHLKPTGPKDELAGALPLLSNAELVQMRVRIIALENLVIALLADASDRQIEIAREMAAYIVPRPGFTPHP